MDILSKDTRLLLDDTELLAQIEEILEGKRTTATVTIEDKNTRPDGEKQSKKITVRRLVA